MCFEDADFVYKDPLLFQNDNDPVVTLFWMNPIEQL